jgi:hypothetical protein
MKAIPSWANDLHSSLLKLLTQMALTGAIVSQQAAKLGNS